MPARRYLWGGMPMRRHARVSQSKPEYEGVCQGMVHTVWCIRGICKALSMRWDANARACQSMSKVWCCANAGVYQRGRGIVLHHAVNFVLLFDPSICRGKRYMLGTWYSAAICQVLPEYGIWSSASIYQGIYCQSMVHIGRMLQCQYMPPVIQMWRCP